MTRFARLRSWIRASLHSADFERSMRDEMESHLEMYEAICAGAGFPRPKPTGVPARNSAASSRAATSVARLSACGSSASSAATSGLQSGSCASLLPSA
jgi:hypothetical protein